MKARNKVRFIYPAPLGERLPFHQLSHGFDVVTDIQEAQVTPDAAPGRQLMTF